MLNEKLGISANNYWLEEAQERSGRVALAPVGPRISQIQAIPPMLLPHTVGPSFQNKGIASSLRVLQL